MPNWSDYFRFGRQNYTGRNLEDGLFQIASQTCNILVKVNNTNNINLVRNNRTNEYGCAGPPSTSREMQVSFPKNRKQSILSACASKFSTVLESGSAGNASSSDEELEQWEQIFMMRDENGNPYNDKRKKRSIWCRPSCIPVSIVIVLIVLVVLVPLLDQVNNPAQAAQHARTICSDSCRVSLVESIPEGNMYPPSVNVHKATKDVWLDLIDKADNSIEIASFYWTLRYNEEYPDNSSIAGEQVFKALYNAVTKKEVKLRIAQNAPTKLYPNSDTEKLAKNKGVQVTSLNFSKLGLGNGVLHTKFWIVDNKHFYVGSANMDWRSLTQVKELGIVAFDCPCLAQDLQKVFEVYWIIGSSNAVPDSWPRELSTDINYESPANVTMNNETYNAFITSSPPRLSPTGRTNDADAIVEIIRSAEEFVYVAVMEYSPVIAYGHKIQFWPVIDDAIRQSALENKVKVKMLISYWNHSNPAEDHFLNSLSSLTKAYKGVSVEVKRFIVPATPAQAKIPYARVNHNKYMVTDKEAYIGTSNWYGDYFTSTAGVAVVISDRNPNDLYRNHTDDDLRIQLKDTFERDWYSPYAVPLRPL